MSPVAEHRSGAARHIGRNPQRATNQDHYGVFEPVQEGWDESLYLVCDGMGGHAHGELASQIAVQEIATTYPRFREDASPAQALRQSVERAHRAIRKLGNDLPGTPMGTTVVAAVVHGEQLTVANVGDSRAYLMQGGDLVQLTQDHSRMAEEQTPGPAQASRIDRGAAGHALTRSLSTLRESVEPDVYESAFRPGKLLVLCSDGLWSMVSSALLAYTVQQMTPQKAADALVRQANRAGGTDNISVVVVRAGTGDSEAEEDTGELQVRQLAP
jgi:protein phosphatase